MSTPNILRVFDQATPQDIEAGRNWYSGALAQCTSMASVFHLPVQKVVGVVAALSPSNRWERNMADAAGMCAAFTTGSDFDDVSVSTYRPMKEKAQGILLADYPSREDITHILQGPKITNFFLAILGEDVCVVDGHAYNIYKGTRRPLKNLLIGSKEYRKIGKAYARAGKRRDLKAYEMQAITWIVWRKLHGIDKGTTKQ